MRNYISRHPFHQLYRPS